MKQCTQRETRKPARARGQPLTDPVQWHRDWFRVNFEKIRIPCSTVAVTRAFWQCAEPQ